MNDGDVGGGANGQWLMPGAADRVSDSQSLTDSVTVSEWVTHFVTS